MKTVVIKVDNTSSANLFLALAKKLNFNAHVLSAQEKEDAVLLAMMEERKNDEKVPISKTYDILRKVK